jgi:hypothetical protein
MRKFKTAVWDYAVLGALVAFVWGKSAQTILLAVVAFLLYLLARSNVSKSTADPKIVLDDNEFHVHDDELSLEQIDLDSDITFQARKNHFRLDSRFDTVSRDAEYEYKIDGTAVSVGCYTSPWKTSDLPRPGRFATGLYRKRIFASVGKLRKGSWNAMWTKRSRHERSRWSGVYFYRPISTA